MSRKRKALEQSNLTDSAIQEDMIRSTLRQKGVSRCRFPDGQESETRRSESVRAVP